MKKKIIAIIMSLVLCLSLMIPSFAVDLDDTAAISEDVSGEISKEESAVEEVETTTVEEAEEEEEEEIDFELDLDSILTSDMMQEILSSDGMIDITNMLLDLIATMNPDNIAAMGQDQFQKLIQSLIESIGDYISLITGNKDLYIDYDPLKVFGNLFDLDTDSLTTQPNETQHPDELEIGMGDVDGDGKISAADARLILRRAARLITFTVEQDKRADVDNDGAVTAADARIVLRVSAGLITLDA